LPLLIFLQAYRNALRLFHPDKLKSKDIAHVVIAERIFFAVNAAHKKHEGNSVGGGPSLSAGPAQAAGPSISLNRGSMGSGSASLGSMGSLRPAQPNSMGNMNLSMSGMGGMGGVGSLASLGSMGNMGGVGGHGGIIPSGLFYIFFNRLPYHRCDSDAARALDKFQFRG
jgi:hypothetical protein